jgi:hypothetical protein
MCNSSRTCLTFCSLVFVVWSGCSGGAPPGGLDEYTRKITSAEDELEAQGAKVETKAFGQNQSGFSVDLSGKEIKPETLEALAKLGAIGELNLSGSTISDSQMEAIGKLNPLYGLHLGKTAITDAGFAQLKQTTLVQVDVRGSKVTHDGVVALKKRYAKDPGILPFFKNLKVAE